MLWSFLGATLSRCSFPPTPPYALAAKAATSPGLWPTLLEKEMSGERSGEFRLLNMCLGNKSGAIPNKSG